MLMNVLKFPVEVGNHDARVVGVDGRVHAGIEQFLDGMGMQPLARAGEPIAGRAELKRGFRAD